MRLTILIVLAFIATLLSAGCKKDKETPPIPGPHETERIDNTLISGNSALSFQRTIGGTKDEVFNSIVQNDSGEYICIGYKTRHPSGSILHLKLDSLGKTRKISALRIENYNYGTHIERTIDDRYVMAWSATEGSSSQSAWTGGIMKFDQFVDNDNWFHIDGTSVKCHHVLETVNGGYALTAMQYSDSTGIFITTDANLNQLSRTEFNNQNSLVRFDHTSDGGYISCGVDYKTIGPSNTIWIKKLDASTNATWSDSLALNNDLPARVSSIIQTSDGYVVTGDQTDSTYVSVGFVIKFDLTGNLMWQKDYQSYGIGTVQGIVLTAQNQLVAIARDYNNQPFSFYNGKAFLFSLDEQTGSIIWHRSFLNGNNILFHDLRQTSDSGFIISGSTYTNGNWNGLVVKTDEFGN